MSFPRGDMEAIMARAYFAKGVVSIEIPAGAVVRYGTGRSDLLVLADGEGRPLVGWRVRQQGCNAWAEPIEQNLLRIAWSAFQKGLKDPQPERTTLLAEIEAFDAWISRRSSRTSVLPRFGGAVLEVFERGVQPLGRSAADLVCGTHG